MRRLRPNMVSTGCTDTRLDCVEQSPQPSHTASLAEHALLRIGNAVSQSPRLAARRLVVDQNGQARNFPQLALHRV